MRFGAKDGLVAVQFEQLYARGHGENSPDDGGFVDDDIELPSVHAVDIAQCEFRLLAEFDDGARRGDGMAIDGEVDRDSQ
jgi:hypothetical protein